MKVYDLFTVQNLLMFGAPLVCSWDLQVYISIHKRHLIFHRCDFQLKKADRVSAQSFQGLLKQSSLEIT